MAIPMVVRTATAVAAAAAPGAVSADPRSEWITQPGRGWRILIASVSAVSTVRGVCWESVAQEIEPFGIGMTIIDGIVRTQRSRNTPPAGRVPEIVNGH